MASVSPRERRYKEVDEEDEDDSGEDTGRSGGKLFGIVIGVGVLALCVLGVSGLIVWALAKPDAPGLPPNCNAVGANHSLFLDCVKDRDAFFKHYTKELPAEIAAHHNSFSKFLLVFQRNYVDSADVEEYTRRLTTFAATKLKILERNAALANSTHPNKAVHGITKYADWTVEEFRALLGGKPENDTVQSRKLGWGWGGGSTTAPCTKNWIIEGGHEIRNQGKCGNCWSFSVAETVREAYISQGNADPGRLSTQFLTDCFYNKNCGAGGVNGCCGGNPSDAMSWIGQQGGIPTQAAYGDTLAARRLGGPVSHTGHGITYSGNNPTTRYPCKAGIPKAVTLSGSAKRMWNEADMADHVCKTGSLSIMLDASQWQTYKGGVFEASSCGHKVDHAVVAVGIDKSKNAWIIQNSWGEGWGATHNGHVAWDKSSNCPAIAGVNKAGCANILTNGWSVRKWCKATCNPSQYPSGGYIFLEYGKDTCRVATGGAYSVPTISPAR